MRDGEKWQQPSMQPNPGWHCPLELQGKRQTGSTFWEKTNWIIIKVEIIPLIWSIFDFFYNIIDDDGKV